MKRQSPRKTDTSKSDLLVQATYCSTRGAEYEDCLLYLGELRDKGMSVSSDKAWTVGSLVYLQLEFPDQEPSERELFLTCKVKQCTPHLGGLCLYELQFFRLPEVKRAQVNRLLGPYVAPNGRQYYRHYCANPFEITVRVEHSTSPVEDISCGGLNFTGVEKLEVGEQMESKLFLDDFAFLSQIRVDWREEKNNGYWEYGCSFQQMEESDSKRLKDYIYQRATTHSVAC